MNKFLFFFILLFLIIFSFISSLNSLNVKAAGNQWTNLSSMPTKRGNHRAIEYNGKILQYAGKKKRLPAGLPSLRRRQRVGTGQDGTGYQSRGYS